MADTTEKTGWLARAKSAAKTLLGDVEAGEQISQFDYGFGADYIGVDILLGSGKRANRSRMQIYEKFHYMLGDPIISTALSLHVTMALGGHETTGDTVFIERNPDVKDGDARMKIIEDLQRVVAPILNAHAHTLCFNAIGFGDAYARVMTEDKVGLVDIISNDLFFPPLIQSYERGNTTMGFVISTGRRLNERLTVKQMVRMKMPRKRYLPQTRALEKAIRANVSDDDLNNWAMLPALVGGSFLEAAEEPYDNLRSSLVGLVGQRILSSIDETLVGVNLGGMTKEQRSEFMGSLKGMLKAMKDRAEQHVKDGEFSAQRNINVLPTSGEKQLVQVSSFQGSANGGTGASIEDVMFFARLLAGALGIDLSMLGFADQLTGGLGEGGFSRTSAQAAENSGIIRTAFTAFANALIDLHTYTKYGWKFEDGDRPYAINFYGSISSLESEEQASRERNMNATAMKVSTLQQLRDLGLNEDAIKQILVSDMKMDEDAAILLAKALKEAKPAEGAGGEFGGGFPADGSDNTELEGA